MVTINTSEDFQLTLHDELHTVRASDVSPDTTLNEYLRKNMFLTGTKVMCREGGCGSCIVAATAKDPFTNENVTFAINSCLVSIFQCSGWKISTVEGIGNATIGYHPIQKNLAKFNGTQCGFCSSGMVMNMYALYEAGTLSMNEIENSFGGNLCRCTGYRPILAAFKSMALDLTEDNIGIVPDIEDAMPCAGYKENCERKCPMPCAHKETVCLNLGASKWYKVYTIDEIFVIFRDNPTKTYKLVSGNTAKGVYWDIGDPVDIYIDVQYVKQLLGHTMNTNTLVIGANNSLTYTMNLFNNIHKNDKNFAYLEKCAEHIDLVATVPVRNIGSIAGNLSIKHIHREFPSDIYLLLETVGALLTIVDANKLETKLKPSEYLTFDMNHKIIKSVTLPTLDSNYVFNSYKIMPRAQNAHAHVNAAFLFKLKDGDTVEKATICYGGINPTFTHALTTEKYWLGRKLFSNANMQSAFITLSTELKPDYVLPDPKPEFRKALAIALLYKFILSIATNTTSRNKSGGLKLIRPLSKGVQDFDTNESMYPISQPINKIEALAQTTGEAEYIQDMPDLPNQHFGAFVLGKAPVNSVIIGQDTTDAMKIPGVVSYVNASDIKGKNSFLPPQTNYPEDEEIFCSGTIKYFFEPVGMIIATSQLAAEKGAEAVKITYRAPLEKPLLTIRQVLASKRTDKINHIQTVVPGPIGNDNKFTVTGTYDATWQYHFHMETQCCNIIPVEDGFDIFPSTQWMDLAQTAGAVCLGIPINKINVKVRRIGGAYGAKISRNNLISCAGLIASSKVKKPIKVWMPFTTNMNVIGKRNPVSANYVVKANAKGVIQSLVHDYYTDAGIKASELPTVMGLALFTEQYDSKRYMIDLYSTRTDNHAGTWTRAPGSSEGLAMIENIMEHISQTANLDPLQVRLDNLSDKHPKLRGFIADLRTWANIDNRKREIDTFNTNNRWRKRGISVVPMAYDLYFEGNFPAIISIYQGDGSVSVAHGGIEMGQGINTKVAQTVAHELGIPLDQVSIKPSNELVGANSYVTGGSQTSECVCMAAQMVCKELIERMKPVKDANPADPWALIVKKCFGSKINLTATNMWGLNADQYNYLIYGVTAAEVELDCLTGNHIIKRVDLLEDTGTSMSPFIDIGQVEGAYIMGMGYWTSEEYLQADTGEVKTNRTWTYKIPGAKDIPVEFNVKFPSKNPNNLSPFKTKATAEPPLCMSVGIPLALKQAIKSARIDADPSKPKWTPINGPSTVEQNFMSCLNNYTQYTL